MKTIWNGITKENPTFVLLLGLCPALAVTNKFENAYLMGICVLMVLLFSNFVISLIKKWIPDEVRIPVYILIIGTFVTITEMLLKAYVKDAYQVLGIYLPLIVVNCIVLGRALSIASKESVSKSILDAIGIGLGFTFALLIIAFIREILGSNSLTIMDSVSNMTGYRFLYKNILPGKHLFPMPIFSGPAGAFLTLGFMIAIMQWLQNKRRKDHESH